MVERVIVQDIDYAWNQKMTVLRNNVALAALGGTFTVGGIAGLADPTAGGLAVLGSGVVSSAVGGVGIVRACRMPNQDPELEAEVQTNHAVPRSHQRSAIYEANRNVANHIVDRSNHSERSNDTDRSKDTDRDNDTNTRATARTNEQGHKKDKKVNISPKPRPRSIERTMNPY